LAAEEEEEVDEDEEKLRVLTSVLASNAVAELEADEDEDAGNSWTADARAMVGGVIFSAAIFETLKIWRCQLQPPSHHTNYVYALE
jgi:hypothetical protein